MRNDKKILIQKIKNGIAAPFSDELIHLIKPAVRLYPRKNKLGKKGISKMGGLPLIGKNENWPRTVKGKPYAFLLQIDLEDINKYEFENPLPKNGALSFFFNLETWDDAKIFYHKKINN